MLKGYWRTVAAAGGLVGIALVAIFAPLNPSVLPQGVYEQCQSQSQPGEEYCTAYGVVVPYLSGVFAFLNANSDAINAAATVVIGVFTFTLWRANNRLQVSSRRSVNAAFEAVEATRSMGRDQNRAYVTAEAGFIEVNYLKSKVCIRVKNTGVTPARWLSIDAVVDVFNADDGAPNVDLNECSSGKIWGAVPNGSEVFLPTACPNEGEAVMEVLQANGLLTFRVFGRLRYGTIFGEVYETEFAFHTNNPNVRTPMVEGDDIPIIDQPCKMLSAPEHLTSYKKIAQEDC